MGRCPDERRYIVSGLKRRLLDHRRMIRRTLRASGRGRTAPDSAAGQRPAVIVTKLETVGFLLADVARLMRKDFDRRVRSLGLTRAQWRVLVYVLENQGLSQSALARLMDLERAPLGQLVRSLENLRLVYAGSEVERIMPQLTQAAT